ncbi:MAG: hypothetical protein CMK89_09385 [Pseudomonadales bacterium]|jgi:hypothetical protein|nr:hypothetical protein [Pseudomonadales bacterium]
MAKVYVRQPGVEELKFTGLQFVRVANTFWSRLIGLLSRKGIEANEGLLIIPCSSIHTFFMRFTIDLVFLDRENRVLGTCSNVKPNRVRFAPRRTHSVLEIAEGNVKKTGIHLDDFLIFD